MSHKIYEPAASVLLGREGAPVMGYETGLTSERLYQGQPYSRLTVMALCTNGEMADITVPGAVDGLSVQQVREAMEKTTFLKVKFTGLELEEKGGEYNKLTRKGTADKAELVTPPVPSKS